MTSLNIFPYAYFHVWLFSCELPINIIESWEKFFIINSRDRTLYRVRFLPWKEYLNRFYFLTEFSTSTIVWGVHVPLWAQKGQRATLGDISQNYNLPSVLRVALAAQPAPQEASCLCLPMHPRAFNVGSVDNIQILNACILLIGLFPQPTPFGSKCVCWCLQVTLTD